MSKLKLMGARRFLDMPTGTIYIELWKNSEQECLEIIEEFLKNPSDFLSKQGFEVYGDNYGSMGLIDPEDENADDGYIFFYDANVVGDASPETTLYLVFDEKLLPDVVHIHEWEESPTISKDKFLSERKRFLKYSDWMRNKKFNYDNTTNPNNEWARNNLETEEQRKNSKIVNAYFEADL